MENKTQEVSYSKVKLAGRVSEYLESFTLPDNKVKDKLVIDVMRNSGVFDRLRIIASAGAIVEGEWIGFEGRLSSRNVIVNGISHLEVFVEVNDATILIVPEGTYENSVEIRGYLCKDPVSRITPLGRDITDLCIAVNRTRKKSYYFPCLAWYHPDSLTFSLNRGDVVRAVGRFQSRNYTKNTEEGPITKTAYEVSLTAIKKENL